MPDFVRVVRARAAAGWDSRNDRRKWERRWARDDYVPIWDVGSIPDELRAAVARRWFSPGARVVDIGCGGGELAAWLAAQGFDVVGVDYAKAAIGRARRAYRDVARLRFERVDITRATPRGGPFDALVDRACLHVLPTEQVRRYVRNVAAAARPGARFLLLYGMHWQSSGSLMHRLQDLFRPAFEIQQVTAHRLFPEPRSDGAAFWMVRRET
jgi:2-polyprenyl-3-methyl-5-hydroxy-6-metoxy-1,4-benzoquinol methylase